MFARFNSFCDFFVLAQHNALYNGTLYNPLSICVVPGLACWDYVTIMLSQKSLGAIVRLHTRLSRALGRPFMLLCS